jgi:uncharacterized membrane protein
MDIYLSYTDSDKEFANKLTADLKREGFSVWLDQEQIPAGANFIESILAAIGNSNNYLALVSSKSSESPWASTELATALAAKEQSPGRKIIPIIAEPDIQVPPFLRQFKAIDLSSNEKYQKQFPELLNAIKSEPRLGPLPAPDALKRHEEIAPGMAELIISMAQSEQHHRWETERQLIHGGNTFKYALAGALFAVLLIATIAIFGEGTPAGDIFKYLSGFVIGVLFPVFKLIAEKIFSTNKKARRNDRG